MLPSERARQKRNAELDATGTPWSTEVPREARVRLTAVASEIDLDKFQVAKVLQLRVGRSMDWRFAVSFASHHDDAALFDIVAVIPIVHGETSVKTRTWIEFVNLIFQDHRIGYKFVGTDLIPFEDDELMRNVIEPTLGLLIGEKYGEAKTSYREALEEIADGNPGDAMTDAGRALQQTLQALGCKGNMLGPLLRDAKHKGLLGNVDAPLMEGIEKFFNWASANRNELSDAHNSADLLVEDGWLMIHVVGALIQRLAAGTPRQAQPEAQDG